MGKTSTKLIGAVGMLVLSIVMLTVGTFAWWTISTTASIEELSITFAGKYPLEATATLNDDGEPINFEKQINLSSLLAGMNDGAGASSLRPISTYDMINWYSVEYSGDGSVQKFSQVPLDTIANLPPLLGTEDGQTVDKSGNCLIYFDIWVRATIPGETWGLQLSTAKKNSDGTYGDKMVTDEVDYGTYVVAEPTFTDSDGYDLTNSDQSQDAMNSIRVGFAQLVEDPTDPNALLMLNRLIYEPNADVHTSDLNTTATEYYRLYNKEGTSGTAVQDYSTGSVTTLVPYPANNEEGYVLLEQRTVKQDQSTWNVTELRKVKTLGGLHSNLLSKLGAFSNLDPGTYQYLTEEQKKSGNPLYLCDVSYDKPQRIRVYIWLEGQDIDCWNQIMGGSILANFEFVAADPVNPPEEPSSEEPSGT